jgi:hypothetical protein
MSVDAAKIIGSLVAHLRAELQAEIRDAVRRAVDEALASLPARSIPEANVQGQDALVVPPRRRQDARRFTGSYLRVNSRRGVAVVQVGQACPSDHGWFDQQVYRVPGRYFREFEFKGAGSAAALVRARMKKTPEGRLGRGINQPGL